MLLSIHLKINTRKEVDDALSVISSTLLVGVDLCIRPYCWIVNTARAGDGDVTFAAKSNQNRRGVSGNFPRRPTLRV